MSGTEFVLELNGIWKSYGGTQALKGGTMSLERGKVYGLVGGYGAGKSALVKSRCGAVIPDSGTIKIDGNKVTIENPQDARNLGVSTVFQELSLIPDLSLAENMQLQRHAGWTAGRNQQIKYADDLA